MFRVFRAFFFQGSGCYKGLEGLEFQGDGVSRVSGC